MGTEPIALQLRLAMAAGLAAAIASLAPHWSANVRAATPAKPAAPSAAAKASERVKTNPLHTGNPALFGKILTALRYTGLKKTVRKVVDRELLVAVGKSLGAGQLHETVQRLRNLGVFRTVTARLERDGAGVKVVLRFDEKWTLLPVLSWGRGGDRLFLAAGGQDIHVAGRLFQAQALYTLFAGTHSVSLRFDDPRLFDKRYHLSVFGELANRNRFLYDGDGKLESMYSRHRNRAAVTLWDRHNPRRVWAIGAQFIDDTYDNSLLGEAQLQLNNKLGFGPPDPQRFVTINASYRLGRLDVDDYIVSNGHLTASSGVGIAAGHDGASFLRGRLSAKWAWALPYRQNVVARVEIAGTTATAPEFHNYVGGLWYVRGFFEGRFRGPLMWAANLEYRVPSIHSRLFVLQHVVFVDSGDAGGSIGHFGRRPGIAFGTGGRVILPMIAKFVARLDVAWFVEPVRAFNLRDDFRISFGSQQHF